MIINIFFASSFLLAKKQRRQRKNILIQSSARFKSARMVLPRLMVLMAGSRSSVKKGSGGGRASLDVSVKIHP
jgi:hypothetical protein